MALKFVWNLDPTFIVLANGTPLRYYSLCMVAVFIGGYLLLSRQIRRGGGDIEEAGDFLNYGAVGVIVGGRLGHALFYDLDKALADPVWILKIWTGGLSSHGAAVGVALAMFLFTSRRSIPLLEGTDRLVYSAVLGAILIRIGNIFNSENVGRPTDGTWGVQFPRYDRLDDVPPFRHPVQLYEIVLALLVLALLVALSRTWKESERPRGVMTGIFLVAYFGGRFLVEFVKERPPGEGLFGLDMGQLLSIPAVILGCFALWYSGNSGQRASWEIVVPERPRHAPTRP